MPNLTSRLSQSLRTFSHKRTVRRTFIGLVVFIILIGLFGWLVLPGIVKSQAEQRLTEMLHRQTSIGKVEINPYAMRLTVRDMKMMEPAGDNGQASEQVFASFDALTVNLSWQSLFRFAPVVEQLKLETPYVHLVRKEDNGYNIDDILALGGDEPPSPEPARFSLFNIEIDNGRIEFDDKPAHTVHQVSDLKVGIPFISSLPSQVEVFVEPLLSARVNDTPLLIKGQTLPFADPMEATVDLDFNDLDLTAYLGYIPGKQQFKVPSARLDVKMVARFQQKKDAAPALVLNGDVKLRDLQLNGQDDKSIARLPELAVTLQDAKVLDQRIDIARIGLKGLQADIARDAKGRFNFDNLLIPAEQSREKPAQQAEKTAAAPAESQAAPTDAKAAEPSQPQAPAKPSGFSLALAALDIEDAALRYDDAASDRPLKAGVERFNLQVRNTVFEAGKNTLSVEEVASDNAELMLQQGKPRRSTTSATATKPAPAKAGGKQEEGMAVTVGKITVANWSAKLEDRSLARPAVTTIAPLTLNVQDFSTAASARSTLDLQAAVNKTGKLAVKGSVGMTPVHADLALDFSQVDIMQLQPYFTDQVNILLTRAALSGKGALKLDQGKNDAFVGGFKGNLALGNLATVDKLSTNDFLRWKALTFTGMDVKFAPFSLNVDQVALNDFFARIIIDPNGRINLQDVARNPEDAARSVTEADTNVERSKAAGGVNTATAPVPGEPKLASDMPPIKIGKLLLRSGQVRFTDNFIKPNYTANLMKFGGTVAGLSSDPQSRADVDLNGLVNSAPLSVAGNINPLKGDLAMDIKAEVRGMELAPLSPYSGRYIGYGIEKGKLSFDVAYKVEDRTLTAQNRLILEQLTLGDKMESSEATNLPVHFALALLRDRNGVIDINLPIGGSLDDPEFSVGGLIVKVIVNVITKAVTAPFSLIGSLFGGGEEMSHVAFDAGRARIPEAGEEKLRSVAKMLEDRPALKLEITGRTDAATDREGLKRAAIDQKVRALKLKDMVRRGESGDVESVTVTEQEYPALLKRVYKDEDFKKPRNMVGLQKDIPVPEMEALMIENTTINDDDLTALGNRRAQNVKEWLLDKGKVPEARIFILATKTGGGEAKEGEGKEAPNRVDFSLR